MSALIHFVGIVTLVTASNIQPVPHLLMPRFRDIISKENNVITIPSGAVDHNATTWPLLSTSGGSDNYLIDVRDITITAEGDQSLGIQQQMSLPRLTCCCIPMREGLSEDYANPGIDSGIKKAAFVALDHGFLSSAQDPHTKEIHLDLLVSSTNDKLTITGSEKNKPDVKIVVNLPPTASPIALDIGFLNKPDNGKHEGHWQSYYRMGKNQLSKDCPAVPSSGGVCAPKTQGCLAQHALRKAPKTSPKTKWSKSPFHRRTAIFTNVDCSDSGYP